MIVCDRIISRHGDVGGRTKEPRELSVPPAKLITMGRAPLVLYEGIIYCVGTFMGIHNKRSRFVN